MKIEDLRRMKVGVLMGGISSEREISMHTGLAVLNALKKTGMKVVPVVVDEKFVEVLRRKKIDIAFIALHGKFGEDGSIQGILEFLGIPYTSAGVLGSAISMNKLICRKIWEREGIPVPPYRVIEKGRECSNPFGYPCVVKPVDEGSSVGVSIVDKERKLKTAVNKAFEYSDRVLIEKYIKGKEVHIAILNNRVLGSIEVRPKRRFYDYEAKYTSKDTEYILPPTISMGVLRKLERIALKAHKSILMEGATRVDAIVKGKRFYLLEINSIPGMTERSLLPKIARSRGISFENLVMEVLRGASLKIKRSDYGQE